MEWRHEAAGSGAIERLLVLFRCLVAVAFVGLIAGFWHVQVVRHPHYAEQAGHNHQRRRPLPAPRGVVFDRNGQVMVADRDVLNLALVRERVDDWDGALRKLAEVTGAAESELRAALEAGRRRRSRQPIVVLRDASRAQVAAAVARRAELPGLVVEPTPVRSYPAGALAAHALGHVGEVTAAQLAAADAGSLRRGRIVGQSGVELSYNRLLMGVDGARRVLVDSAGREMATVGEVPPVAGQQLRLTIDLDVQRATEAAFQEAGFDGAAVVLDPRTGEVLALVSLPAYDPNAFASGIDGPTFEALARDRLAPLRNRALQGRYPPGSTFKLVTAIAALEEGVVDPDFTVRCDGGGRFYGRFYQCHARHGVVGFEEALEQSCNTFFYTLGTRLDVDQIHHWASRLGLGRPSGIDLLHEARGLVPSRAWKRRRRGESWHPGETVSVAIGQGQVAVTPISQAVMMASLVNGGRRITPRILQASNDGGGWTPAAPAAPAAAAPLRPQTLAVLERGLWSAVNRMGTGRRARIPGREVLGKTGTAQVISRAGRAAAPEGRGLEDHGWFVFAAPAGDPQIAGAVLAEHAGHGYLAAPIARRAMETWFARQEGRPLPVEAAAPSAPAPLPAPTTAPPPYDADAAAGGGN